MADSANGKTKLLLTSIFTPFGIKTRYADGVGMQAELLNNQITRMQGVHSPREIQKSYGLYVLAENVECPCTVLDFPSWRSFKKELKNGYTHVGISFIVANVLKAKRMAEYIRKHYPDIKIIVGGGGAVIADLDDYVPYDYKCIGDGISWLRALFNEDVDKPIKHPLFKAGSYRYYGHLRHGNSAIVIPGLGCVNGCDFCSTSAFFQCKYVPILKTGKDVFNYCKHAEQSVGSRGFFILDENFLKESSTARELLALMTKEVRVYGFDMFASADTINELGVDFLIRLGIRMVWIGVESKLYTYEKLKGLDIKALIAKLQSKGISVLASSILFLDHHDEETLYEDIDWAIDLESDLVQFMNCQICPGTPLYKRLEKEGRLRDLPYTQYHGQEGFPFVHPHFNDREIIRNILIDAHKKKYHVHGPATVNMAITAITGCINNLRDFDHRMKNKMAWNESTCSYEKTSDYEFDEFMRLRLEKMKRRAKTMRILLLPAKVFAPNKESRDKARWAMKLYDSFFGGLDRSSRMKSYWLLCTGTLELLRIQFNRLRGRETIVRQPIPKRVLYRQPC